MIWVLCNFSQPFQKTLATGSYESYLEKKNIYLGPWTLYIQGQAIYFGNFWISQETLRNLKFYLRFPLLSYTWIHSGTHFTVSKIVSCLMSKIVSCLIFGTKIEFNKIQFK